MSENKNEIRLEKITFDNYGRIVKLGVAKAQRSFVASNSRSLIHAYIWTSMGKHAYPFGIYLGKKPIGFVMIGYDGYEDGEPEFMKKTYFIWRFMIDRRYQGRGYGREAFRQAMDFVRTLPCGESEICWLSYEPENEAARRLYASFGFVEAPESYKEGEEMPAILRL
ncbi:MAG: GNAT family N-acetyltransferase [Clostridia bacterium]|nr:GNAT family N-acetyltransferase [Clostridia bacterium]